MREIVKTIGRCVLALLMVVVVAPRAPPRRHPPQEGFVPVDQLEGQEQMPGGAARRRRVRRRLGGGAPLRLDGLASARQGRAGARRGQPPHAVGSAPMMEGMTSAHFIFIPAVLIVGVVIGWILGGRAARDAYRDGVEAAGGTRRAPRTRITAAQRPIASRCARLSGRPASRMRRCASSTG